MRYLEGSFTDPSASLLPAFKSYLRVAFAELDAVLVRHLTTARIWFERQSRIITTQRTITAHIDLGFPAGITLERVPTGAITAIRYLDTAGTLQTLDASQYDVDLGSDRDPCRIVPAETVIWPCTARRLNAVRVEFTAGYSSVAAIPEPYRDAIFAYGEDLFNKMPGPGMIARGLLAQAQWKVF